jgi:phosphate:Na+ symporter
MDYWTLFWGIWLFLLGMMLMSEWLKAASWPALARILEKGTNTRLKWFISWFLATAILQSSTATTLLTIGFVNAGIMTFINSLWVIFGTNVGTTMTWWLVAMIGLKIKVELFALPLIGAGVAMRILWEKNRFWKIGDILSGFGILFLGIGFLQTGFSHIGTLFDFASISGNWLYSILCFLLWGLVLTIVMQSSSASIAVILTIASTTNIPLQEAAASVIWANIGTTLTAILAAIWATANAKRTASGHVIFNSITGIVALLILPWIIWLLDFIRPILWLDNSTSTSLALFHTVFNILGVFLMIPLASIIARILGNHFRENDEKIQIPKFLDKNLLDMPTLAIDSLSQEIKRLWSVTIKTIIEKINALKEKREIEHNNTSIHALYIEINNFIDTVNRESKSLMSSKQLSSLIQVNNYYNLSEASLSEISFEKAIYDKIPEKLQKHIQEFLDECITILTASNPLWEKIHTFSKKSEEEFEVNYRKLKSHLLKSESNWEINVFTMDAIMKVIHIIKWIILRTTKSLRLLKSHIYWNS